LVTLPLFFCSESVELRKILELTKHTLLVGDRATDFALSLGNKTVASSPLFCRQIKKVRRYLSTPSTAFLTLLEFIR